MIFPRKGRNGLELAHAAHLRRCRRPKSPFDEVEARHLSTSAAGAGRRSFAGERPPPEEGRLLRRG